MTSKQPNNLIALVKMLRERSGAGILACRKALIATKYDLTAAGNWLRAKGIASASQKSGRQTKAGGVFAMAGPKAAVLFELQSETDFVARNQQFLTLSSKIGQILTGTSQQGQPWLDWSLSGQETIKTLIADQIRIIGENIVLGRVVRIIKDPTTTFTVYNHYNHRLVGVCAFASPITDQKLADELAMHVATIQPLYRDWKSVDQSVIAQERQIQTEKLNQNSQMKSKPAALKSRIIAGQIKKSIGQSVLSEQPFVLDQTKKVGKLLANHHLQLNRFAWLTTDQI